MAQKDKWGEVIKISSIIEGDEERGKRKEEGRKWVGWQIRDTRTE